MKDSKTIRNEHQSFVDAYKKINESSVQDKPVEEGYGYKSMDKKKKKTKKEEMVLVRKSNAFTSLAEKYNMSPKQFGRYVEANQHLFDIPTRKKAILANKFQGFKETKEWDEFFGDLELVEMDLKKLFKLKKGSKEQQDLDPTSSQKKDKLLQHKLGQELDKAHYELEGELVDEGAPYVVTNADKSGNTKAYQGLKSGKKNAITGKPLYTAADHLKLSHEPEGEDLQEITTKDTKSGTKFKVRVKDKATGSSYIRFATRDKIAQLRSDPKIASVEMTDEGQTPEERGEKKAQAAGGGSPKKAKKDYDGDGKVETGSQEYLGSRDKAIKKAMKKRSVTTEAQSNWREDLKEIMGEVEKTEGKKPKSKKMKNGICINPDTDDEKNKYEEVNAQKIAENLGAELQSLKIEDADGNVAYEVVDLVKPDPIKEDLQKTVTNILDKGSNFMKNTKVGRVLKKVFGPSKPSNQGSDYTPDGKVPRK